MTDQKKAKDAIQQIAAYPPEDFCRKVPDQPDPDTTKATPRPWYRGPETLDDSGCTYVSIGPYPLEAPKVSHYEESIAEVWSGNHDADANAQLIVAAVNAHDGLLADRDRMRAALKALTSDTSKTGGRWDAARKALAASEGNDDG